MQIIAMRIASFAIFVITAAFTGLVFWADGASVGELIVSALVVAVAVILAAQKARSAWAQSSVAAIYLGSVALCGVVAHLLNGIWSEQPNEQILGLIPALLGVGLGWAICDAIFEAKQQTA